MSGLFDATPESPGWSRHMAKKHINQRHLSSDPIQESNASIPESSLVEQSLRPSQHIVNDTNPLNSTMALPGIEGNSTTSASDDPVVYTTQDMENWVCAIFLVFVMCYCSRPQIPDARYRMAARRRAARRRQHERLDRMKDPRIREKLIDKALWIQKVTKREHGQLTLGPLDSEILPASNDEEETSIDSLNEETSTCIICLEPFCVGDVVAWSKGNVKAPGESSSTANSNPGDDHENEGDEESGEPTPFGPVSTHEPDDGDHSCNNEGIPICQHVFHQDCIKEWLMNPKHDDCPACREKIIEEPADDDEMSFNSVLAMDDDENDNFEDVEEGSGNMSADLNAAFVVVRGLVSQVQRTGFSLVGSDVEASVPAEAQSDLFVIDDDENGMELVSTSRQQENDIPSNPTTAHSSADETTEGKMPPAMARQRAFSEATEPCKCCHASTPPRDKDLGVSAVARTHSGDTMDTVPMSPEEAASCVSSDGGLSPESASSPRESAPVASPDSVGPIRTLFRNATEGHSKVPFRPRILSMAQGSRYAPLETSGSLEVGLQHGAKQASNVQ
mmetsp:Transcript_20245/g.43781  ORF Transcript_20245/g.43781 Transcript_20245/m.43781 type:complete len:561 (+) Transcript_20245:199-1881(+)|eukprot:CAMPEP_0168739030 /NCGR_PEP_ID=MMETSP0724-20121128/11242_1 /TAXON_ID=265536 /ORGANISM="Amphiprora sp., Strain CCMP467" /LENGTH=560 /DNA_ID=CAMNT_0008786399 /DNA_START=123 /DNA_END=1805 /DNA_ORIENTATION=-